MCLTGVDCFPTLGYQPGIAFLAAGLLSLVATLVWFWSSCSAPCRCTGGWRRQARNGQGSIGMLEKLFPKGGKSLVLILLGFATTDFAITMTLSANSPRDEKYLPLHTHRSHRSKNTTDASASAAEQPASGLRQAGRAGAANSALGMAYYASECIALFPPGRCLLSAPATCARRRLSESDGPQYAHTSKRYET